MITAISIKEFKGLANIDLVGLSGVNIFLGKNNSGKSSILHAVHISCLAIELGRWNEFQPKLDLRDLISNVGNFEISVSYSDGAVTTVQSTAEYSPIMTGQTDNNRPRSISIIPDVGLSLLRRVAKSPFDIYNALSSGQYNEINSIEILYALKYYSEQNQKGLTAQMYTEVIES